MPPGGGVAVAGARGELLKPAPNVRIESARGDQQEEVVMLQICCHAFPLFRTPAVIGALFIVLLLGMVAAPAGADEGMWLPHKITQEMVDAWRARGLELGKSDIYNKDGDGLTGAIIQLGGGTGSFVSIDGLILTNHHVAFGALQRSSTVNSNYIQEGFLARTRVEEIPALGYEALVELAVEDVTDEVLKTVNDGMSDYERYKAIEKQIKKIVKKAEKGKDVECRVRDFYGGLYYYLYTYFKIKDCRIVYAPPLGIGEYGGDIDNWMWPRHTGDFSFLRAYVGPDGKSAEYAEDNVPYHPKRYLAVSRAPLEEGGFTMVIGYPGSTRRYRTSYSIDHYINRNYPQSIKRFGDIIAILDEESAKSEESAIKLASTVKGLNNAYKNNQGMLEGLLRSNLLEKKLKEEAELRRFIKANPDLEPEYRTVLDDIKAQYDEYLTFYQQNAIAGYMGYLCTALREAITLYKWSDEREKEDIERDPGYMDRDEPRVRHMLELADLRYDEGADKRVFAYFIKQAMTLPENTRIRTLDKIFHDTPEDELDGAIESYLDKLYEGTGVTGKEARMKMFGMEKGKLLALKDPFIALAAELEVERKELEKRNESFAGALDKLRPRLMKLWMKYRGGLLYPDANGTMRVSAGEIKGYSPRDAVHYDYITSLNGVIEKYTGERPFDAPQKLLDLYEAKDFGAYVDPALGDVPVCFLSTNDLTGGNSGSPIMNGKGEVIGTIFDGNYESISADFQFVPRLTRSINCDSRYILFILEKFAGADELLRELKIVK